MLMSPVLFREEVLAYPESDSQSYSLTGITPWFDLLRSRYEEIVGESMIGLEAPNEFDRPNQVGCYAMPDESVTLYLTMGFSRLRQANVNHSEGLGVEFVFECPTGQEHLAESMFAALCLWHPRQNVDVFASLHSGCPIVVSDVVEQLGCEPQGQSLLICPLGAAFSAGQQSVRLLRVVLIWPEEYAWATHFGANRLLSILEEWQVEHLSDWNRPPMNDFEPLQSVVAKQQSNAIAESLDALSLPESIIKVAEQAAPSWTGIDVTLYSSKTAILELQSGHGIDRIEWVVHRENPGVLWGGVCSASIVDDLFKLSTIMIQKANPPGEVWFRDWRYARLHVSKVSGRTTFDWDFKV